MVSAPLAGAAYPKGYTGKPQYHWVVVKNDLPTDVLCGDVLVEHVLDDVSLYDTHPVTCKACLSKARSGA